MATVVNTVFRLKRGTAARLAQVNPVLMQGEPCFAYDTNQLKIGDGIHAWNDLPYIEGKSDILSYDSFENFPTVGDTTVIYKATKEKCLYQYNSLTNAYEKLNSTGGSSDAGELADILQSHSAEIQKLQKAIDEINDIETGILALAKAYADTKIPGALVAPVVDNITLKISDEGIISVKEISIDLLTQGEDELILFGGTAI